jgi:hypothetical protein
MLAFPGDCIGFGSCWDPASSSLGVLGFLKCDEVNEIVGTITPFFSSD